ncbi:MAG: ABC transporter permease, partial [Luteimonas sp.]|nr:ABC transporter permease [Luteimonas sp.]
MEIRPILSTLMRHKTAAALIVLEIALTCAIICNALFMIGARITQLREVSGLAEDELVRIQITGIGNDANAEAQTRSDLAVLRGLPGVTGATVMNQVPFVNSSWNSSINLQQDQQQPTANATVYMAEDRFVDTLGLKLVSGRDFNPDEFLEFEAVQSADGGLAGIPASIITRALAERLFPGEDAVGKVFYSWGDSPIRIVGVVDHLVRPSMQGGPSQREYSMVFPIRTHYNVGGNYMVRTSPERRDEILKAASDALRANGANRIILEDNTKSVEQLRREFYQEARSMAWLLGIVCVALLLITALGIVGLASFWVQQRTKQIGVRRA